MEKKVKTKVTDDALILSTFDITLNNNHSFEANRS